MLAKGTSAELTSFAPGRSRLLLAARSGRPLLSAMQRAGKFLVSAAKRIGMKTILPAVIAIGIVLGSAQRAQSSTVTITVTGVVNSATDRTGVFGFAPGTDLSGQEFTLTFTFDDTKGKDTFLSNSSVIVSTNSSNPGTAVLQIGAGAYEFGLLQGPSSEATVNVGIQEYYLQAGDGYYGNGDDIQVQIYAPDGTTAFSSPNWETAVRYSSSCPSSPGDAYNISFWIGNLEGTVSAGGYMLSCGIVVSGPMATDPVAKSLGDPNKKYCGCAGDPIAPSSGNVFEQVTDYSTAGPNPLQLIRYYNSMGDVNGMNTFASSLGKNWRTNYDRYLQLGKTTVVAERPDGQQITFTLSGGVWKSQTDIDATLTESGATWTLTDHDDTVETYKTASGQLGFLEISYGQLESIRARNGYTQTINHVSGEESTVTDSYGRTLTLDFDSGLLKTVTTPDSLVLTYTVIQVTGGNRLYSVSYNTTPVARLTYLYGNAGFPFALTGVTDENGKRFASWTYDGSGRGVSSEQGAGAGLTALTYNANGTTTVTNAFGVAETYKFAILQGTQKVIEIDRAATATTKAAKRVLTYDGNGYLSGETDWNGGKTTFENDAHGDPTTMNEAVGSAVARTTTIGYDTTWVHLPHEIVTPGLTSTFGYDSNGNQLTRTDRDTTTGSAPYATGGQTRVTARAWSATGELLSVQLPRTDVTAKTSYTYGADGALIQIEDALKHLTKITAHTGGGLPLTVVDSNGVKTTLTYDARLNVNTSTLATTAGALTTTYTHDAANNLTAVELPNGSKLTYGYDAAHRLTSVADLFGDTTTYTLDALGDRTATVVTGPGGKPVTRKRTATFDALGRMLTDVGGTGQTTVFTYDNNGNMLTIAPPAPSGVVTYTYDALNRRATAADPAPGGTTATAYDAHDRVTTVKDANGNTTAYIYDGFGDPIEVSSPDSGVAVYRYDADGNLSESVRPGPLTATMTYDALDRLLTTAYPSDTTLAVARTYDQAGHGFGVGRMTSATDQAGTLSLKYDERGNVTGETRVVTGAGTLALSTSYDAAGRVARIYYPSGTLVAYERDAMGRTTSVLARPAGTTAALNVATGIGYEPFGAETSLTFGNGIQGAYGYDLDYRPTTRMEKGKAATESLSYGYFANNSVETITDALNAANTQAMTYDSLDRLTGAASGAGGYGTLSYTWDPVGNVETQTLNGSTTKYSLAAGSNRLATEVTGSVADTVGSTLAGNISSIKAGAKALDSFSYNQANELKSAQGASAAATYDYDLRGMRIEKALPGMHPVLYSYNRTSGALLAENDLNKGTAADYIYLNGRPIGEVNPTTGKLYFTHTDRLGTPQKLTDATQAVVWSALYQPFGGATFSGTLATQSLRLSGQVFDAETGLYHNGYRDYAPGLTRYVESDLIGLAGGVNTYQYAEGRPLGEVDPVGLNSDNQLEHPSWFDIYFKDQTYWEYMNQQNYNNPGYFTFGAHGVIPYPELPAGASIDYLSSGADDSNMSVWDVGDQILGTGWGSGSGGNQAIELDVCYAGAGGYNSFAQRLANYLARVTGAPVTIWASPNPVELIGGKLTSPGTDFQPFAGTPPPGSYN